MNDAIQFLDVLLDDNNGNKDKKDANTDNDFDIDGAQNYYLSIYPKKLDSYLLIPPQAVSRSLAITDAIRYIHPKDDVVSCVSIVVKIKYNRGNKHVIDQIFLKNVYGDRIWRIYPSNYYIFRYDKGVSHKKRKNITALLNKTNNTSEIKPPLTKEIKKETLKKMGATKQQIDLDDKIDKHFEKHNNRKKSLMDVRVTEDNIDDVVNTIFSMNNKPKSKGKSKPKAKSKQKRK